jgi:hypothetical protein
MDCTTDLVDSTPPGQQVYEDQLAPTYEHLSNQSIHCFHTYNRPQILTLLLIRMLVCTVHTYEFLEDIHF